MTVAVVLVAASCGGEDKSTFPRGGEPVELDPANFTTEIDNPYWPMQPGNRWVYRELAAEGPAQRVEVVVTAMTREIVGIEARVIHDVVTEDGEIVEDTFDWYAQDSEGNIWYLGEDTKELENGKVTSTRGSWEAGVDGAQAGVLLPGEPQVGTAYREEYYEGEAEDAAEVVSLDLSDTTRQDWQGADRNPDDGDQNADLVDQIFADKFFNIRPHRFIEP